MNTLRGWTSRIWNGECSGHNATQVSGLSKRPSYMSIVAILFNGADPFGENVNILSTEDPM